MKSNLAKSPIVTISKGKFIRIIYKVFAQSDVMYLQWLVFALEWLIMVKRGERSLADLDDFKGYITYCNTSAD